MPQSPNEQPGSMPESQDGTEPQANPAVYEDDAEDFAPEPDENGEGGAPVAETTEEQAPEAVTEQPREVRYQPPTPSMDIPDDQDLIDGLGEDLYKKMVSHQQAVARATWLGMEQQRNQYQSTLREKGWNAEMLAEYGQEAMGVIESFAPEVRSGPVAAELGLQGAILNRVAQGASLPDELEKAAALLRGTRVQQKPAPAAARPQAPAPVRQSQVQTRSDRPASVTAAPVGAALTRREAAVRYLMNNDGMTREQAEMVVKKAAR